MDKGMDNLELFTHAEVHPIASISRWDNECECRRSPRAYDCAEAWEVNLCTLHGSDFFECFPIAVFSTQGYRKTGKAMQSITVIGCSRLFALPPERLAFGAVDTSKSKWTFKKFWRLGDETQGALTPTARVLVPSTEEEAWELGHADYSMRQIRQAVEFMRRLSASERRRVMMEVELEPGTYRITE